MDLFRYDLTLTPDTLNRPQRGGCAWMLDLPGLYLLMAAIHHGQTLSPQQAKDVAIRLGAHAGLKNHTSAYACI